MNGFIGSVASSFKAKGKRDRVMLLVVAIMVGIICLSLIIVNMSSAIPVVGANTLIAILLLMLVKILLFCGGLRCSLLFTCTFSKMLCWLFVNFVISIETISFNKEGSVCLSMVRDVYIKWLLLVLGIRNRSVVFL